MLKSLLALAASALLMTGTAPVEAALAQTAGAADLTPSDRGAYVTLAGAFHLYELRSAEKAAERSRDARVRSFAEAAAADYQARVDRLLGAARASGLDGLDPAMLPMHWEMLRELEDSSRSRFDRRYIEQQVRAHELALALHSHYAAGGDSAELREVAAEAAELAQRHLDEVRALGS